MTDPLNPRAFPSSAIDDRFGGMGLLDHFAGLAMQGIVGSIDGEENYNRLRRHAKSDGMSVSQWIGRDAYKQADAMLAERAKRFDPDALTGCADDQLHGSADQWRAAANGLEIWSIVEKLTEGEGNTLTVLPPNQDFNGQPNYAIECEADWTGWMLVRFANDSRAECFRMALAAFTSFSAAQAANPGGDHEVAELGAGDGRVDGPLAASAALSALDFEHG